MIPPNLFGLPDADLKNIVDILHQTNGVLKAKIFGSRAIGNYREGSDIDLAVEAPTLDHNHFLRLCSRLDDLMLPYKIDIIIMHQIDNDALLEHIERVGVSLW
ncbi:MAG: nucleotidyltransferase domain-containing protein [Proteobacteria bacterium]|nr:nucleotidyltransferase domain-containing protein [Pseudomonadota bacterium]